MTGDGICVHPRFRSSIEAPSLWESRRDSMRELHSVVAERHRQAKVLCKMCPLLRQCEQALSDFEKAGTPVDGVMAGRYADTGGYHGSKVNVLKVCEGCGQRMIPQRKKPQPDQRQHVGEGLCQDCYPMFGRFINQKVEAA